MATQDPIKRASNFKDITGKPFTRLVVLGFDRIEKRNGTSRSYWFCLCMCGKIVSVSRSTLESGDTQSCGCKQKEMWGKPWRTHGMARSPEHNIWCGMKARCTNPKNLGFHNYGGRGITVCPQWVSDFPQFYADMGPRPGPEYSIERRNNDEGYTPENCYWALRAQQSSNKRNNHFVTIKGKTRTVSEWIRTTGISFHAYTQRLVKGEDPLKALTRPVRRQECLMTFRGETLSVVVWAQRLSVSKQTLYARKYQGWTDEETLTIPIQKKSHRKNPKLLHKLAGTKAKVRER